MFKIIIPIIVLAGAVLFGKYLMDTAPDAKKKPFVQRLPIVEIQELKLQPYTVYIESSGIVKAGTQTNLVSEVSGRVVSVADRFQEGDYFDKDQTLLSIDPSSYLNAVDIAKSEVEANRASLKQINEEEKSNLRAIKIARQNVALGKKELNRVQTLLRKRLISASVVDAEDQKLNQLVQRLQDLEGVRNTYASRRGSVKAKINSTLAKLKQENLNLTRTKVKAPYAGRVLKKNVDIGQFVSTGSVLGEIYATDFVNIELPLSLSQYELLGMPEAFRNTNISSSNLPTVTLTDPNSISNTNWKGKVVRSSAALDSESRQLKVIVQVDNPYIAREGVQSPIRIGQYLKASIKGRTFNNVYVLPPGSVLYNREIRLLVDGKISVKPVKVIWNSGKETVVKTEQNIEGEQLILTNLSQAVEGMKVLTTKQHKEQSKKRRKMAAQKKDSQKKKKQEQISKGKESAKKQTEFYKREDSKQAN